MSFTGMQFSVKEEPNEADVGDQNIVPNVDINIKQEEDYLPDNPEFVNLDWKEGYNESNLHNNESTNQIKFNAKEWGERYLKKVENNAENNLLPCTSDTKISNDLDLSESTINQNVTESEIPHELTSGNLKHFMLNENSGDSTRDTNRTDSDQEWSTRNKDGEYTCKICKVRCSDQYYLQQHFKSRRLGDKSYKCCSCNKIFRDNTQLSVHSRKHTGEKPYSCSVCNKKFSVNGNLSKHMRIHTGERRYECFTCERKFTQFAHLEDHIKTHSGERPYVCDFCNSAFKTPARLRKHKKSHEDERVTKRSVPCPICMKVMMSSKQLISHMETHDEGPHNPFPCKACGKTYKNLFALNIHLKSHGNTKDFQCTLCEKAFTNASHLRRHSNSHSGYRPFVCQICNRGFPSTQNLKRHLMTHTGEKPFSCDQCSKSFLTLENLNRHKRTHTGEKPFPCNICGRYFAHSTTAKEHMRIHTGDKPFACNKCDRRFSLNKALYKHMRERHPDDFPEFKRQNDLPPNVRKAREKLKREFVSTDESDRVISPTPDSKVEEDLEEVEIKSESVSDIFIKREPIEKNIEPFMETLKLKPVEIKSNDHGFSNGVLIKKENDDVS